MSSAAAMVTDEKILEVAGVVTAGYVSRRVPHDPRDIYQEAALAALEARERYGRTLVGNPFAYLAMVAGVRTKRALNRSLAVVSISEHVADGRDGKSASDYQRRVPIAKDGLANNHPNRGDDGTRSSGEERIRLGATQDRPEVVLSGEMDRLRAVVSLFRRLDRKERRLVVAAMDGAGDDLDELAKRTKVGRARAARVIKRFVSAVGDDPAVAHLRRVISAA